MIQRDLTGQGDCGQMCWATAPLYSNTEHTAQERSPGWLERSLTAKIQTGWKASSKNEQNPLWGAVRKGQTGVQADRAVGSGCSKPTQCFLESPQVQSHPGDEITVLRVGHQAGGMKVADSPELTLDDPRVSASLRVFCTFPSIHELQPELSETLVSGAQQGRCKINRIWSAARDLTRLQRLWYFTEAQNKTQLLLLPSVCYCFYFKKKPFQEQIKPNNDVSSSCTFIPRHTQTGWLTGYSFAICFQVCSFIHSHILAPSISEDKQLHRCSINKLHNLLEEVFCLFF